MSAGVIIVAPERTTLAANLDKGNYNAVMRVLAAEGISA